MRLCPKCGKNYENRNDVYCIDCRRIINHRYAVQNRQRRTQYRKKYRKTLNGKKATKSAVKRYELKNPNRKRAWGLARSIERKPCIKCDREDSVRHHPDITKPKEVVMLCHLHHKIIHLNVL